MDIIRRGTRPVYRQTTARTYSRQQWYGLSDTLHKMAMAASERNDKPEANALESLSYKIVNNHLSWQGWPGTWRDLTYEDARRIDVATDRMFARHELTTADAADDYLRDHQRGQHGQPCLNDT